MTKFGEVSRVATATIFDDSGSIKLTLWNENIDKVSPNSEVQIENGYVTSFRGENQLNVGRYGKLTVM
jgi:replication factor A1